MMACSFTRAAALGLGLLSAMLVCAGPAHAAGGGRKVTASESYMAIGSVTASIVQDFQVRAVLQVEVGLNIPDSHEMSRADRLSPRLRSRLAEALRAYSSDQYAYGRVPDVDLIAGSLQNAVDGVLGPEHATVYLGAVIVHATR